MKRLADMGNHFFTHNDMHWTNVLTGEKPILVDWETASLSPAGQSLRVFSTLPADVQKRLVRVYADAMPAPINERDVLLIMGATQAYHWLSTAVGSGSLEWHQKALTAFDHLVTQRL